jgi:adenosylhomocysteine nucleosidase
MQNSLKQRRFRRHSQYLLASTLNRQRSLPTARIGACFLILALSPIRLAGQADRPVAILGAMPAEIELLRAQLQHQVPRTIAGIEFIEGTLSGRSVVITRVGVGKVNAAITTTLLLEHYQPQRVIFTGVAGALDSTLSPGDIVIATYSAQHDLGALLANGMTNFGVQPANDSTPNPIRFLADTLLLRVARMVSPDPESRASRSGAHLAWRIREGAVLTGDVFLANDSLRRDLRRRFPEALAVEMEGAAVAQVCWQFGRVPLLVVRSISDAAGASAPETYREFLQRAAANSSEFVARIVAALPAATPRD